MTQTAEPSRLALPTQVDPLSASEASFARGAVVLGMHRSGTSAVAGLLVGAGFDAGRDEDLWPADESNPKGYFERAELVTGNDGLLARLGGSWDCPPAQDTVLATRDESLDQVRAEVRALLSRSGGAPVVLKDPRISVLLPLWWPVLKDDFCAVLVLRNPLETARSLARRDGMSVAAGLALWEVYLTAVLAGLEGYVVHLARYDKVLADPGAAAALVQGVAARLRPDLAADLHGEDWASALAPELHRNQATATDLDEYATQQQRSLWAHLSSLGDGPQLLTSPESLRRPSGAALATIRQDAGLRARLGEATSRLTEQAELMEAADRERDLRGSRVAELETTVSYLGQRVEAAAVERDQRGQRVAELEAQLVELQAGVALADGLRARADAAER
ncbi:MAG: hypothetical protein WCD35_10330, partial [Mycobacteriales bacterium]